MKKFTKKVEKKESKKTVKKDNKKILKQVQDDDKLSIKDNKRIKVLFASAEVAPFSKVGGLADVVGSLPKALDKIGVECEIFTPYYGQIDREKHHIKFIEGSELTITFGHAVCNFTLSETTLPNTNIKVYFVDNYKYFSWFYDVVERVINFLNSRNNRGEPKSLRF